MGDFVYLFFSWRSRKSLRISGSHGDWGARYVLIPLKTTPGLSPALCSVEDRHHIISGPLQEWRRVYPDTIMGKASTSPCLSTQSLYVAARSHFCDQAALQPLTASINLLPEVPTLLQLTALAAAGIATDVTCTPDRPSPDLVQRSLSVALNPCCWRGQVSSYLADSDFAFRRPRAAVHQHMPSQLRNGSIVPSPRVHLVQILTLSASVDTWRNPPSYLPKLRSSRFCAKACRWRSAVFRVRPGLSCSHPGDYLKFLDSTRFCIDDARDTAYLCP